MVSGCDGSIGTMSFGGDGSVDSLGFGCTGIVSSIDCCEDIVTTFTDDVVFVVSLGLDITEQFGIDIDEILASAPPGPRPDGDILPINEEPTDGFLDDVPFILGAGALGASIGDYYIVFSDVVATNVNDDDITKSFGRTGGNAGEIVPE